MPALSAFVRASLWWLLPLAALALALGFETDWGRAVHKRPPVEAMPEPKPLVVELLPEFAIAGGVEARRETVERTLFNPTRRPAPAPVVEAQKPRMQRGQFALTGTLVIDGKSTAFLREVNGGKARRVKQGETINGLTVAEVKPDRIRLALGDESEELLLRVATNPRPTPTPAPASAAGTPPAGGAGAAAMAAAAPPGATPAATPNMPAPQDVGAVLAERRRAAGDGAAPAPAPTPAPAPAATMNPAATATDRAAPAPDPAWGEVYQRMQKQPRR
jgi:hypothetical protein